MTLQTGIEFARCGRPPFGSPRQNSRSDSGSLKRLSGSGKGVARQSLSLASERQRWTPSYNVGEDQRIRLENARGVSQPMTQVAVGFEQTDAIVGHQTLADVRSDVELVGALSLAVDSIVVRYEAEAHAI
ncbi:hypothetical protein [Nocardia sp. NPDC003979]